MAYDGSIKFDTSMDMSGFQKDANSFTSYVKGMGVFEILKKGLNMVAQSFDKAVSRYDTLNKFPKVLEQMGYNASEAGSATKRLSDGVSGLPTTLDDIVSNTQQLVTITKDLDESTGLALALNDAFLASGSSSADAARGTTQFVQMLSKGKVDMQSWMTLQETMAYGLDRVAQSFGFTGQSARTDFYEALKSGEITFDQFSQRLIELDSGIDGFAEMARTATGGIGTAFTNMKTAIVKGSTSIIESVDRGLSKTKFKSIENVVTSFGKSFRNELELCARFIEPVAANLDTLMPLILGVGSAWATWKITTVLTGIVAGMQEASVAVSLYSLSVDGAITVDALHSSGLVAKEVIVGALTGQIGLATAAQHLWNVAMESNPIGVVLVGIIALTAGLAALIKALDTESEASKEARETISDLKDKNDELQSSLEKSAESYQKTSAAAEASANMNRVTAEGLFQVVKAHNEGTASAEKLRARLDLLNSTCKGLNVTYDEATGSLSMTNEQIMAYINASEKAAKKQALADHMKELENQLASASSEIDIGRMKLELLDQQMKAGELTTWEYTKRKSEMEEQIAALGESSAAVSEEMSLYEKEYSEVLADEKEAQKKLLLSQVNDIMDLASTYHVSYTSIKTELEESGQTLAEWTSEHIEELEANKQAIEDFAAEWGFSTDDIIADMNRQGLTFEEYKAGWEDLQDAVEERSGNVINSFKKIPTEFDMSAKEMLANLVANKETYAAWEANMEEITRQLGPTAAEEFRKLGPEANSAMEEILKSPELLEQYREALGVKIDEATGAAIEDWNDPNFIGAPSSAADESAVALRANTSLPEAASDKVVETKTAMTGAVESGDFTGVGTKMAEDVGTGFVAAIVGTTTTSTSSMKTLVDSIMKVIDTLYPSTKISIQRAMTGFVTAVRDTRPQAYSASQFVVEGAVSGIRSQQSAVYDAGHDIGYNYGRGMLVGMASMESSIMAKARSIANKVVATMQNALEIHSPSGKGKWLFEMFLTGGIVGLDDKENALYGKVEDISDEVIHRMERITKVLNGSLDNRMMVAMNATQSQAAMSVRSMDDSSAVYGMNGGGSTVNQYTYNNTFNSPKSVDWRDFKTQQELRQQRLELLGRA